MTGNAVAVSRGSTFDDIDYGVILNCTSRDVTVRWAVTNTEAVIPTCSPEYAALRWHDWLIRALVAYEDMHLYLDELARVESSAQRVRDAVSMRTQVARVLVSDPDLTPKKISVVYAGSYIGEVPAIVRTILRATYADGARVWREGGWVGTTLNYTCQQPRDTGS